MAAQALITLTQLKNPWNVTEPLTALHVPHVIAHVTSSGNCEEKCAVGPSTPIWNLQGLLSPSSEEQGRVPKNGREGQEMKFYDSQ